MSNSYYSPAPYIIRELLQSEAQTEFQADFLIPRFTLGTFTYHWFEQFKNDWLQENVLKGFGTIKGFNSSLDKNTFGVTIEGGSFVCNRTISDVGSSHTFTCTDDGWYLFWVDIDKVSTSPTIKHFYLNHAFVWSSSDIFVDLPSAIASPNSAILLGYVLKNDSEIKIFKTISNQAFLESIIYENNNLPPSISFSNLKETGIYSDELKVPYGVERAVNNPNEYPEEASSVYYNLGTYLKVDSLDGLTTRRDGVGIGVSTNLKSLTVASKASSFNANEVAGEHDLGIKILQDKIDKVTGNTESSSSLFFKEKSNNKNGFLIGRKGNSKQLEPLSWPKESFILSPRNNSSIGEIALNFYGTPPLNIGIGTQLPKAAFHVASGRLKSNSSSQAIGGIFVDAGQTGGVIGFFQDSSVENELGFSFGQLGDNFNFTDWKEELFNISRFSSNTAGEVVFSFNQENGGVAFGASAGESNILALSTRTFITSRTSIGGVHLSTKKLSNQELGFIDENGEILFQHEIDKALYLKKGSSFGSSLLTINSSLSTGFVGINTIEPKSWFHITLKSSASGNEHVLLGTEDSNSGLVLSVKTANSLGTSRVSFFGNAEKQMGFEVGVDAAELLSNWDGKSFSIAGFKQLPRSTPFLSISSSGQVSLTKSSSSYDTHFIGQKLSIDKKGKTNAGIEFQLTKVPVVSSPLSHWSGGGKISFYSKGWEKSASFGYMSPVTPMTDVDWIPDYFTFSMDQESTEKIVLVVDKSNGYVSVGDRNYSYLKQFKLFNAFHAIGKSAFSKENGRLNIIQEPYSDKGFSGGLFFLNDGDNNSQRKGFSFGSHGNPSVFKKGLLNWNSEKFNFSVHGDELYGRVSLTIDKKTGFVSINSEFPKTLLSVEQNNNKEFGLNITQQSSSNGGVRINQFKLGYIEGSSIDFVKSFSDQFDGFQIATSVSALFGTHSEVDLDTFPKTLTFFNRKPFTKAQATISFSEHGEFGVGINKARQVVHLASNSVKINSDGAAGGIKLIPQGAENNRLISGAGGIVNFGDTSNYAELGYYALGNEELISGSINKGHIHLNLKPTSGGIRYPITSSVKNSYFGVHTTEPQTQFHASSVEVNFTTITGTTNQISFQSLPTTKDSSLASSHVFFKEGTNNEVGISMGYSAEEGNLFDGHKNSLNIKLHGSKQGWSRIDSALRWNTKIYLIKGFEFISYDIATSSLDSATPSLVQSLWPKLKSFSFGAARIDATINTGNDKAYFFQDSYCIRYTVSTNQADLGYPKKLISEFPGLMPFTLGGLKLDAAYCIDKNNIYFIKGGQYILYDLENGTYLAPQIINDTSWPILSGFTWGKGGLDAATHDGTNAYYFYKNEFIKVNALTIGTTTPVGFPVSIDSEFSVSVVEGDAKLSFLRKEKRIGIGTLHPSEDFHVITSSQGDSRTSFTTGLEEGISFSSLTETSGTGARIEFDASLQNSRGITITHSIDSDYPAATSSKEQLLFLGEYQSTQKNLFLSLNQTTGHVGFLEEAANNLASIRLNEDSYTRQLSVAKAKTNSLKTGEGVTYSYYEGSQTILDDFYNNDKKPNSAQKIGEVVEIAEGTFTQLNSSTNGFIIDYSGYIYIDQAGSYTFHLASSSKALFFIDNLKFENPLIGVASPPHLADSIKKNMKNGYYPFRILYYNSLALPDTTNSLVLSYEGPDTNDIIQVIPRYRFFHHGHADSGISILYHNDQDMPSIAFDNGFEAFKVYNQTSGSFQIINKGKQGSSTNGSIMIPSSASDILFHNDLIVSNTLKVGTSIGSTFPDIDGFDIEGKNDLALISHHNYSGGAFSSSLSLTNPNISTASVITDNEGLLFFNNNVSQDFYFCFSSNSTDSNKAFNLKYDTSIERFEISSIPFANSFNIEQSNGTISIANNLSVNKNFNVPNDLFEYNVHSSANHLNTDIATNTVHVSDWMKIGDSTVNAYQTSQYWGLNQEYFEYSTLSTTLSGISSTKDPLSLKNQIGQGFKLLTSGDRDHYFRIKFTGYVEILEAGNYTFHIKSSWKIKLKVNGTEIIGETENEGQGSVTLTQGYKTIELEYAQDGSLFVMNKPFLSVEYAGPSFEKRPLHERRLFHSIPLTIPATSPTTLLYGNLSNASTGYVHATFGTTITSGQDSLYSVGLINEYELDWKGHFVDNNYLYHNYSFSNASSSGQTSFDKLNVDDAFYVNSVHELDSSLDTINSSGSYLKLEDERGNKLINVIFRSAREYAPNPVNQVSFHFPIANNSGEQDLDFGSLFLDVLSTNSTEIQFNDVGNSIFQTDTFIGATAGAVITKDIRVKVEKNIQSLAISKATTTVSFSDSRLKNKINPLEQSLDKLVKLRGLSHLWEQNLLNKISDLSRRKIGVSAQEVEKIYSELIVENNGRKTVNYEAFNAILLDALQSIGSRINALEFEEQIEGQS